MAARKPARRSRAATTRRSRPARRSVTAKSSTSGRAAKRSKRATGKRGKAPALKARARKKAPQKKTAAKRASAPKSQNRQAAKPKSPQVKKAAVAPAPPKVLAPRSKAPERPPRPSLERERRRVTDDDRIAPAASTEAEVRARSAARSGHDELRSELGRHTETSPVLTAGDVDAKWEDAYAVGDEAPGGDNPTPDQDRVDDIGKALGVTYEDAEELRGSDKIAERDAHRWELDPASADDWPHDPKK